MSTNRNPSTDDYVEMLQGLIEEARDGRLKAVSFALVDPRMPDSAMIGAFGSLEMVEIVGRHTVQEVALELDVAAPVLAKAIREGMPTGRATH